MPFIMKTPCHPSLNPPSILPRICQRVLVGLLLLALALPACATPDVATPDIDKHGAVPGRWTQDYTAAQALAKERNLPLFLNFTGSDWCPWCKLMDKEVFSTDEWEAFAPSLVLVFLDRPSGYKLPDKVNKQNAKLREQYAIEGFPTYVLTLPDGTPLDRLGATREPDPELFIQKIRNAIPADLVPKAMPAAPGRPASLGTPATPARPAAPAANPYAPRTWTSAAGTAITASYVSYDGRAVTLRLPDGSLSRIALANLSEADQQFLAPLIGHRP